MLLESFQLSTINLSFISHTACLDEPSPSPHGSTECKVRAAPGCVPERPCFEGWCEGACGPPSHFQSRCSETQWSAESAECNHGKPCAKARSPDRAMIQQ